MDIINFLREKQVLILKIKAGRFESMYSGGGVPRPPPSSKMIVSKMRVLGQKNCKGGAKPPPSPTCLGLNSIMNEISMFMFFKLFIRVFLTYHLSSHKMTLSSTFQIRLRFPGFQGSRLPLTIRLRFPGYR